MEDLLDDFLSEIDEYYPGSKKKRKEKKVEYVPKESSWDSKTYIKTLPSGQDVEFFTIGALASALNRPVVTIRLWTRQGHLPPPPFRLPDTQDKYGVAHKGRTLYTRPMIEAAIEIFKRNGVFNQNRIEWANNQKVTEQLSEAWSNLRTFEN